MTAVAKCCMCGNAPHVRVEWVAMGEPQRGAICRDCGPKFHMMTSPYFAYTLSGLNEPEDFT